MFDDGNTPTATAPLELAEDFTERELILLGEAVGQAVTATTGMLVTATFIPSAGAFVVRPAVVVNRGHCIENHGRPSVKKTFLPWKRPGVGPKT